jgi:hypothetical protein
LIVVPLEAGHLQQIRPQAAQVSEVDAQRDFLPVGQAWAAVVDGRALACAGLVEIWPGRAYAWALLDRDAGRHMLALTRAIRSRLAAATWRRVEMAVDAEFAPGARFAEMLGFERECRAAAYFPNGHDAYVYVRVSR